MVPGFRSTTRLKPVTSHLSCKKGQTATKRKSAADKIYHKIEDKLQDKLRPEIPTENSSPPARPSASYDPGHGWPKLFAGYDYSGRKY